MISLESVVGFSTGFVLGAAVGLAPACRKFLLGFLAAVILIQFYVAGSVATYQISVSEMVSEFISHQRFAGGALAGGAFGLFVAMVAAFRRRNS